MWKLLPLIFGWSRLSITLPPSHTPLQTQSPVSLGVHIITSNQYILLPFDFVSIMHPPLSLSLLSFYLSVAWLHKVKLTLLLVTYLKATLFDIEQVNLTMNTTVHLHWWIWSAPAGYYLIKIFVALSSEEKTFVIIHSIYTACYPNKWNILKSILFLSKTFVMKKFML